MKNLSCVAGLLVLFCISVFAEKIDYNGHKVVEFIPKSAENLRWLDKLEQQGVIRFWSEPTTFDNQASFQISPENFDGVFKMLTKRAMSPSVLIDNIEELINKQNADIHRRKQLYSGKAFDLENFHTYTEITDFLKETAASNPLVDYSVIGKSYEGVDISQVVISTDKSSTKSIIFLECGIHAREWVSPSTCLWIIDQLANNNDAEASSLLDRYDWIVVPITNPDGYEYSWTSDRLWRKNRAPTDNAVCTGVDLNRNYDANFGGEGSSPLSCSETYHGPSAFSESESKSVKESLEANRGRVKAYVSIHSYAQTWYSPYGYTPVQPVEYNEMERVMQIGVEAIAQVDGSIFPYGDEARISYTTSGTTRDYAYVGQGIVYAYTIEARSRIYGFVAPPSEILVTAEELWAGIKAMANNLQ